MSTIGPDQQIKLKLLHFLYGHFPLFVATDRFSIFFALSMYRLQSFSITPTSGPFIQFFEKLKTITGGPIVKVYLMTMV